MAVKSHNNLFYTKIRVVFIYLLKESFALILFLPGLIFLKFKFSKEPVLFILNYHNFSKHNNYKIARGSILETGYLKNFEKQIKFFKKYFNTCYPEVFFSQQTNHNLNLLLTFDDGYKDNFDLAAPILRNNNIATIFFISTSHIGAEDFFFHDKIKYLVQNDIISSDYTEMSREINRGGGNDFKTFDVQNINQFFELNNPNCRLIMNEYEVRKLHENGFIIGNHTCNHDRLIFLTRIDQYKSINTARDYIVSMTGSEQIHIAYPNGLFNCDTLEILEELKIKYGYTIIGGFNKKNSNKKLLKRIGINVSDSNYLIILKLVMYSTFKNGQRN